MAAILVRELGYSWTVDQLLGDPLRHIGTFEWAQRQTTDRILRGIDWFIFEPALKIKEGHMRGEQKMLQPLRVLREHDSRATSPPAPPKESRRLRTGPVQTVGRERL
jgi:hypothetical protein